jgi:rare lipoprotein A
MRLMIAVRICSGMCGVLLLFGCSSTPRQGEPRDFGQPAATTRGYKVGKPYQIKGVWYYPEVDYGYAEEGIASWYGPGFHGKSTANGETYDMNDLTAAHRTLPMPSIVRVTNLENGRSLKLKLNDRGPFARERIIDVSRRASQLLGFHMQGTTPVRVEIVEDESRQLAAALGVPSEVAWAASQPMPAPVAVVAATPIEPDPPPAPLPGVVAETLAEPAAAELEVGTVAETIPDPPPAVPTMSASYVASYQPAITYAPAQTPSRALAAVSEGNSAEFARWVQAGAFADPRRAAAVRRRLAVLGPTVASPSVVGGREVLRVRVGPLRSEAEAQRVLASVSEAGFPDSRIVAD